MDSRVDEPSQVPLPTGLPPGWTVRVPALDDLPVLVELRGADRVDYTGSSSVDREQIESEVAGQASWTRRQLVAVDPDGRPRAWIIVHDRAAGRTMVMLYVDRSVDEAALIASEFYAWAEEAGSPDLRAARDHRDHAGRQPLRRGHRAEAVAVGRRLHETAHASRR